MIELKFFPAYNKGRDNEYIELFYGALARCGVHARDDLRPWDRDLLRRLSPNLDVIHFQWCTEWIWREWGKTRLRDFLQVARFWRFLRLARKLGIRVVWTVHDFQHHDGDQLVDRLGYRILGRAADLCICHTENVRQDVIRKFGARPQNTVVMPIGNYEGVYPAPRSRAETLASLAIPEERRVLVCFGRVRPYKGFDLALEALRELGESYHLIIAGQALEADYRAWMFEQCSRQPNTTAILEEVEHQKLADIIHAADCILLPYKQITGSSALLASLTLGRAVVASNLPFFSEILAHDPNAGVLFKAGDSGDLARAIRTFFEIPIERRHQAASQIANHYSWDRVIRPVAEWFVTTFPGKCQALPSPGSGQVDPA